MGYYTYYTLTYQNRDPDKVDRRGCAHEYDLAYPYCPYCKEQTYVFVDDLIQSMINEDDGYNAYNIAYTEADSMKWYEWEDDMRLLSSRFPGWLFTLRGLGEESEDIWIAYFLDGKMQREMAEIVLGEFDPEKLT